MPRVERSALLAYRAHDMYRLVGDVESYPAFLPGCTSAVIEHAEGSQVRARLGFRVRGLADSFATENVLDAGRSIRMTLVDGPFRSLTGTWQFIPLADEACKIELSLALEFGNRMLEATLGPLIDPAISRVIDAFRRRAGALHGRS